jgi:hypothetical protein
MPIVPLRQLQIASPELISRPADAHPTGAPNSVSATLIKRDGRNAQIECEGHVVAARIAFGCLVQPEPGDRVLTSVAEGAIWIVAVLERSSDVPARLSAEGDFAIVSVRGNVSLTGAQGVRLDAGDTVQIAAPEIDLHTGVARFVLDELVQIGRQASLYVTKIRSVGEIFETFAEHVLTRAKRGTRFVEESDQMRAGSIDHRAAGTLQLNAETAFITAGTVVRVDADQIHMG